MRFQEFVFAFDLLGKGEEELRGYHWVGMSLTTKSHPAVEWWVPVFLFIYSGGRISDYTFAH